MDFRLSFQYMFIHHAAVVAISMMILITIMAKIPNALMTRNGET